MVKNILRTALCAVMVAGFVNAYAVYLDDDVTEAAVVGGATGAAVGGLTAGPVGAGVGAAVGGVAGGALATANRPYTEAELREKKEDLRYETRQRKEQLRREEKRKKAQLRREEERKEEQLRRDENRMYRDQKARRQQAEIDRLKEKNRRLDRELRRARYY